MKSTCLILAYLDVFPLAFAFAALVISLASSYVIAIANCED